MLTTGGQRDGGDAALELGRVTVSHAAAGRRRPGDDEPQVAFLEVFNQEVRLPAAATVLGMPVEVVGFDYLDGRRGIVAECRRDDSHQRVAVVDLAFPPDSTPAWVQAAYRCWLGLKPHPYDMPPRWRPSWS